LLVVGLSLIVKRRRVKHDKKYMIDEAWKMMD